MSARIDHIGLEVTDFERSKAFYTQALAPLGMRPIMEAFPGFCGFGEDFPFFWVTSRGQEPSSGAHVAFSAKDRPMVDAFHAAALAAGGTDNGAAGLREYHRNYYGAFVLDPDGHNIEAVCHKPG
jgi:catechol 2,3-dioxygenase-like lactoylglutathione lyase family enzyme